MKSSFKKIGFFLKKHIFSVICLLLATIICISGTLSYSKYITSSDITPGGASAGSFTASASINGISALSFTNTAFWGGSAESDKIAMNALRQLKFSVNNYQTDSAGNKKVAEVRMRYNLVFSAPVVFASKLAFQVFNEHDVALLPQIVLADLLATTSGKPYDTSTSVDYNSQAVGDLEFTVSKNKTDGVETITAIDNSSGVKVTITTFTRNVDQSLLFRLWDVSSLTNSTNKTVSSESGSIKPPVTVNYKQTVDFYKISVTMPDFVLPASVATTINHSIQLAPTSAIDDNQLGGILVDAQKDTSGTITSATPVTQIYGPNSGGPEVEGTIQTLVETIVDTNNGTSTTTQTKVTGNIQNYTVGTTTSSQYSYQTSKDIALTDNEKQETTGTTTTTISYIWNNYELTDKAKEYNTYLLDPDTEGTTTYTRYRTATPDQYADVGALVGVGTANTYGTAFYIHKLAATQTGTEIVSKITSRQLISKTQVTNTEVTEQIECTSISGNKITLIVTKTTDVKESENTVYRTTSEETRTEVTRTGYVYRMYFLDSNSNNTTKCIYPGGVYDSFCQAVVQSKNPDKISSKNETVTYRNQVMFYEDNGTCNYFGDEGKKQYTSTGSSQDLTNTSDTLEQSTPSTETSTETINRVITRAYSYSTIKITGVSEPDVATDGTTTQKEYTKEKPFNLFDDDDIQKYYLSSSYSKNYPFYVDVIFEQVLK